MNFFLKDTPEDGSNLNNRVPEHCISNNVIINIPVKYMYCYLPVLLGLFEPIRRNFTRSEGG